MADDWFEEALDDVVKHAPKTGKYVPGETRRRLAEKAAAEADAKADPVRAREAAKFFAAATAAGKPIPAGPTPAWGGPVVPGGGLISARPPRIAPYGSSGGSDAAGKSRRPMAISPQEAVDAILAHVRSAGDATEIMKAGGQWITAVTNGIAEIIRESGDE